MHKTQCLNFSDRKCRKFQIISVVSGASCELKIFVSACGRQHRPVSKVQYTAFLWRANRVADDRPFAACRPCGGLSANGRLSATHFICQNNAVDNLLNCTFALLHWTFSGYNRFSTIVTQPRHSGWLQVEDLNVSISAELNSDQLHSRNSYQFLICLQVIS